MFINDFEVVVLSCIGSRVVSCFMSGFLDFLVFHLLHVKVSSWSVVSRGAKVTCSRCLAESDVGDFCGVHGGALGGEGIKVTS